MDRGEVRERFLQAALSADGYESLVALVQQQLDQGDTAETLVADLTDVRPFLPSESEDDVLDVMDRLVGWCAPSARLLPTEP